MITKKYESPKMTPYGSVEVLTSAIGDPAESDYFYAHPDSTVTESGDGLGSISTCERPLTNPDCPAV